MTKKEAVIFAIIVAVLVMIIQFGIGRFNAINSGDMKVVSQTQMAERG